MIRMTKTKALNAWIYYCHLEQERRIRLEKEAQERLIRLQAEIDATNEESERILMQKEEIRMRGHSQERSPRWLRSIIISHDR